MTVEMKPFQNLSILESKFTSSLNGRQKKVLSRDGVTVAAVLISLFNKGDTPHVLLTKRSQEVEHHKGEISFPGGKMDEDDPDLLSCALRETEEEVGVDRSDVRIIGEMDDFYTVATNFLVVPFVGVIPYPYNFNASEREIDQVLLVPLDIFFDPDAMRIETMIVHGQPLEVIFYNWHEHIIWGATARIMKSFTKLLT